jgi:hypothetical protein
MTEGFTSTLLGRGNFGEVFLSLQPGEPLAVKRFIDTPAARESFSRELFVAERVRDDHLLAVVGKVRAHSAEP